MNDWQFMKVRPRRSGFYAIYDGVSHGTRYAAFDARTWRWSALRSELSALADALDEFKAEPGRLRRVARVDAYRSSGTYTIHARLGRCGQPALMMGVFGPTLKTRRRSVGV
jgi:hypothetical protein